MAGTTTDSAVAGSSQASPDGPSLGLPTTAPGPGRTISARGPPKAVPIIAIGASAGGLEAASGLLDALPVETGMAFLLVQHLDPTHPSMMVKLLGSHTAMTVIEAAEGSQLLPDQVHVIPPGRYLSVRNGVLHLSPPQAHPGARLPFEFLLKSLAESCGSQTVAVVLSGTGDDGSAALAALRAAGGHVIAQDPAEAEYDGMSRSAIATGQVDRVARLAAIPQALSELVAGIPHRGSDAAAPAEESAALAAIIDFLKDNTPHDFRQYKPGTLERRIERRIALLALERGNLRAYLDRLRADPAERELLARDLLINVTAFFRDPKVFEALAATVLPALISHLPAHQPLRVWCAGCSTGEEAYSLAMICQEAITAAGHPVKLQVFASDVDPDAIATAREGFYPLAIAESISTERLKRHFVRDEAGYRVTAALRGDVVFTVQDVLSDPPFSRIDLVSCRNLLIYLNHEAQAKVIALFHFALREGGVLVLGSAESISDAEDRFAVIAKAERFYRHVARSRVGDGGFPLSFGEALPLLANPGKSASPARQSTLADICHRAVMDAHAPAAILINRKRQCLYSTGPTERYLRLAPGYATLDLLAMATPALRTRLRVAIDKADSANPLVDGGHTRISHDGKTVHFRIDVRFLGGADEELLLVCFVEDAGTGQVAETRGSRGDAARVAELQQELAATQAELQAAILHLETSSQEQKAINEEALSVNEEFQSTNEELLTSKEELQSLNEELTALNSQLQETLERQRLTSDDLQNVLYSTNVGTLFLDMDLKIRFYTPAIKALFSVIASDIGRPLADLRPIAGDHDLLGDARQVLAEKDSVEREIGTPDGAWYVRRIFPYRAHDNRIEGVVITFADVTERKHIARALEAAKQEAERANQAKSRFLAAASHDLRQPLQSLTLLHEMLAQSVHEERPRKLLGRFEQTLAAMSGMLNALLDINQIEAGAVEPRTLAFPISELFDRLREEFTYVGQVRGLSLRVVPSGVMITSDPRLLQQMLRNLLGNALKYTRKGRILVGCRRCGGMLRIEVWDTGIGIAEADLHAIFDEFHQIDNPARARSLGLGLGLSIVQRLGQLLGHAIDVRSIPGRGSRFAITVPIAPPRAPGVARAMPALQATPGQPASPCRIMIVDDDPDVLDLLAQLLRADQHVVGTAVDGDSALNLVANGGIRPDILLTDYNLPNGMDGLELVARMRGRLVGTLPAIILTGDISSETITRIARQDCLQLSKPVKAHELAEAIARLCMEGGHEAGASLPDAAGDVAAKTYVVDDDPGVRTSLCEVLAGSGRSVEGFASAEAFLSGYPGGVNGCLLVDAHLPGMSGVALLAELRRRGDSLPTILITGDGDVGLAVAAMRTGACDFIEKPVGQAELLASVARAIDESRDLCLVAAAHDNAAALVAGLTSRQRQIMDMVLAGQPSKNIAADLGISQRTVENHRAAIMHRMNARSLPELARMALVATAN